MKLRPNLAFLFVLAVLCVFGWTVLGQRQSATAIQWEYAVKHTDSAEKAPANLNELGAQGWELVSVTEGGWAYLKRPKK